MYLNSFKLTSCIHVSVSIRRVIGGGGVKGCTLFIIIYVHFVFGG